MKFEFSKYNKIWDSAEGRQIVEAILQNPDLIRANHTFWTEKFRVDPQITPTNQEGEAIFISKMRELDSGFLMDMRAPLGDSVPEDKRGQKYYSGVIPEFISKGTVEKATERDYKKRMFEQFGDAALIAQYATDVLQSKIDSANQTLSYMSAQLLSTGKIIYNQGVGLQGNVLQAEIPAENFVTAGEKVWSDPTARLLDQIRKIYADAQERWGINVAMQLEIPRNIWVEYFLKNEQIIEWVRYYNSLNNVLLPEQLVVTEDMVRAALAKFEGLPQIVIVEEKQKDVYNGLVTGWKENVAVLRPVGYAGYIRHTTTEDVRLFSEYGNGVNTYSFASAMNGLATVANSVIVNGNFKEWHTHLILPAVPSLDEFLYHIIIDTNTADE